MIPFTNIPYNHELFEQQLSEGILVVTPTDTYDLDCGMNLRCSDCAFAEGINCSLTVHHMSITEPVHMKFKETYPEYFI